MRSDVKVSFSKLFSIFHNCKKIDKKKNANNQLMIISIPLYAHY